MTELDLLKGAESRLKQVERDIEDLHEKAGELKSFIKAMGGKRAPSAKAKASTNGASRAQPGGVTAAILSASGEFGVGDIVDAHPALNKSTIQQTVFRLYKAGQLELISRGLYKVKIAHATPVSEKHREVPVSGTSKVIVERHDLSDTTEGDVDNQPSDE